MSYLLCAGTWDQGGPGGAGPPLELRFYRVKIFKVGKISFFVLVGPPLGKNRSQAPADDVICESSQPEKFTVWFSEIVSRYCQKMIASYWSNRL